MDEVRMDDVMEPGEEARFLVLLDVRETQPVERLVEDGKMDFPYLSLFGKPEGLFVDFVPGQNTIDTDQEKELAISRELLKHLWPALTHYVHTGEWCNSAELHEDKIHLQLDPFQRELLLQALRELKKKKLIGRHRSSLDPIELLELAIEFAGTPLEPGDELS